jgi:hypothetical protein
VPIIFAGDAPVEGADVVYRLVGGSFAAFGLVAWRRRPDSRSGALMTAGLRPARLAAAEADPHGGHADRRRGAGGHLDAGSAGGGEPRRRRGAGRCGADTARGSGLHGLADRVEALAGQLHVTSPPGAGTVITAELPCGS